MRAGSAGESADGVAATTGHAAPRRRATSWLSIPLAASRMICVRCTSLCDCVLVLAQVCN